MTWPFTQLLEVWRVSIADHAFPRPINYSLPGLEDVAERQRQGADPLALRALELAIAEIGKGESGGNNVGVDVARYLWPAKPPANWCAALVGYCYENAAKQLGMPLPFKRSLGAKALGKAVAAVGRKFTDPRDAKPGDVMVFHRGATGSWMGHIAMVEKAYGPSVDVIEGNAGPKVKRSLRGVDVDRFAYFASLRR